MQKKKGLLYISWKKLTRIGWQNQASVFTLTILYYIFWMFIETNKNSSGQCASHLDSAAFLVITKTAFYMNS